MRRLSPPRSAVQPLARPSHAARLRSDPLARPPPPRAVRRLDGLLAEEQGGPTPDEWGACRERAGELKIRPELLHQLANALGRPVEMLRDDIEYDRKMLVRGEAEGGEKLATDLLRT